MAVGGLAAAFAFKPCTPVEWAGRYARVPGDSTVWHVRVEGPRTRVAILWNTAMGRGTCWAVESKACQALVTAVVAAKRLLGAGPGGAFLLDEFGRVLVPAPGTQKILLVGRTSGSMHFENPFDPSTQFALEPGEGLAVGDPWDRPYMGLRYNLSRAGELYFWATSDEGSQKELPPRSDDALIKNLRSIRPSGAVRFLVLPGGWVITKRPGDGGEDAWEPTYAGQVDFKRWFTETP